MNARDPTTFTDLHSHLVPGVDDGARTLKEALDALGHLQEKGVTTLVTTPHLDGSVTLSPGAFRDRMQEVGAGWKALSTAASDTFPEMTLHRGHEVMLDVPHPDLSDPRTRLAGGPFVLVEWPRLQVPPATGPVLARLRDDGHRLILAHPERYHGMDEESTLPGDWRGMGAFLQVNYGSLAGRYGEAPRRRALTLLKRGWVDLFATDFHGRPHLSIYLERVRKVMEEVGGGEQFRLLASVNPARVLQGENPLPVPPLALKKGLWERIREVFQGAARW